MRNPALSAMAMMMATILPLQAQTTLYSSGAKTWDTTTSNWGTVAGGPNTTATWTNGASAVFEGTAGTVALAGPVSLANLTFNLNGSYTISGHALNFAVGSILRTNDNRVNQTITSTITGSPAVQIKDAAGASEGLRFEPATGNTQTLGTVLNPDNTGSSDKAGVTFAGSTTGNTVASVNYVSGDRYGETRFQSGSWTVLGNLRTGTIRLSGGSHAFNGTVEAGYGDFAFTGGTLGGTGNIQENITVPAAGSIAPGSFAAGTLSIVGILDLTDMSTGSGKLVYELGSLAGPNDRIAVTGKVNLGSGTLGFSDFTFTNLGGVQAGTYVLITASDGFLGTLDLANRVGTIGGLNGILQIRGKNLEWATDADLDGMPDDYELAHTNPPSATALDPTLDFERNGAGDGLTNLQEYLNNTDPNNPDSDADGLEDGAEVLGLAGVRPPTNPASRDTDGDTLSDFVETNTGIWVSTGNTGSNPVESDSDKDSIIDTFETNTGTFVDKFNTGTNPNKADTDGDSAGDWYEIYASFTNPNSNAAKPNVPYPLPDPDSSTGATNKPVKVYIMSGQSNMVGIGYLGDLGEPGSLSTITRLENKFPNLIDASNNWTSRNDVRYRGVISAIGNAPLTAGQGTNTSSMGPELGFGHVMGWYHDEPVLLIKSAQGNRSLGYDFLPPGSARYEVGTSTFAGYGDAPGSWLTGTTPTPSGDKAGYQYDMSFLNEADMGARSGSVTNVVDVLDNFAAQYPQWAAQGFEIAGFVWWQGHKDGGEQGADTAGVYASRYEQNLVNLIKKLRQYYGTRYPLSNATNAPFVVATVGFGGGDWNAVSSAQAIWNGQMAVSDPLKYPEFSGNVASVNTNGYWRTFAESPGGEGFHYHNNAETYMLVGDALGRAMVSLQDESGPSPDPMSFATLPTAVNATTVGMVASAGSDVSDPVEYYFENITNGNVRNWSSDRTWLNTGLGAGTYAYRVKARDAKGQETGWSTTANASPGNDITAPTPDPLTFASPPAALGETSISMTATAASDLNGVEYLFECTAGGGNSSSWQDSPTYTDTGLAPGTAYTYRVRARDKSPAATATAWSATASATTAVADNTPPTPSPMTFIVPPAASGSASITMTAITANDPSGVEYFFECTAGYRNNSSWQDSPVYTDAGLTPGTTYSYRVRARDKSNAQNLTAWSAPAQATTSSSANTLYRSVGGIPFLWNNRDITWALTPGGPYTSAAWSTGDQAIFEGLTGTVVLGSDITLNRLTISVPNAGGPGYSIGNVGEDHTLNFINEKLLTVTANGTDTNQDVVITAGIAGSPTLNIAARALAGVNHFTLQPGSAVTQTIGTLNMLNTFGSNKRLILGGSSTGNAVNSITWPVTNTQLMLAKAGPGSWTIHNNLTLDDGRLYVEQGTLTLGGTNNFISHKVGIGSTRDSNFYATNLASKLIARGTLTIADNREYFFVQKDATLSPGPGVQTLTVRWNGNAAGTHGQFNMQTGSTYEWDIASKTSTDVINVQRGGSSSGSLTLGNITLKVQNAGVSVEILATDQLPVFTYQTGVTRSIGTVTIDTSALGAGWSGTPSLVDNGNGTIYLTGLAYNPNATTPYETWSSGALFDADANNDGVENGLAFLLGASGRNVSAIDKLPVAQEVAGGLRLTFQMLPASARGTASLVLEHSNALANGTWTSVTVPQTSGTVGDVAFTITGTNPLNVTATIPVSKAGGTGKLFGRVKGVNP